MDFDVILVSPLERTLETCNYIFGHRKIPIIVEPVISEALRSACDISQPLKGKTERFPHMDFSRVLEKGDLWFLNNDSEENQENYRQVIS